MFPEVKVTYVNWRHTQKNFPSSKNNHPALESRYDYSVVAFSQPPPAHQYIYSQCFVFNSSKESELCWWRSTVIDHLKPLTTPPLVPTLRAASSSTFSSWEMPLPSFHRPTPHPAEVPGMLRKMVSHWGWFCKLCRTWNLSIHALWDLHRVLKIRGGQRGRGWPDIGKEPGHLVHLGCDLLSLVTSLLRALSVPSELRRRGMYRISWKAADSSLLELEWRIKLKCLEHLQTPSQQGRLSPSAQDGLIG